MKVDQFNATSPVVSVIMPTYNCERFVEEAIRSVFSQTFSDWELIVIDDCSTDATFSLVQQLASFDRRVHCFQNAENSGVSRTRNFGLDLAKGNFVAFLDSDDVWRVEKLEKQVARMLSTNAGLSYTSYAIVDEDGAPSKKPYIVPDCVTLDSLLKENHIGCSTVMLSREVADKYRFMCDFYHEDYCLWLDILKSGFTAFGCQDVLVDWRLISGSRSFNKGKGALNRWRIYRNFMKLSFCKSFFYFVSYVFRGICKYFK